jgi:hypothetical protein
MGRLDRRDLANSKALQPSPASLRSKHFRIPQGEELETLLSEEAVLPRKAPSEPHKATTEGFGNHLRPADNAQLTGHSLQM